MTLRFLSLVLGLSLAAATLPAIPAFALTASVIVRLTKGEVTNQAAVAPLMVVATEDVAPPIITTPRSGACLGSPIVILGKATPGYRVEVQVDYQDASFVFGLKGTRDKIMTTADAAGNWAARMSETVRISNAELTITAVTIDPLGRRSETVTTKATLGRAWPDPWAKDLSTTSPAECVATASLMTKEGAP